jgi:hypothetical protein
VDTQIHSYRRGAEDHFGNSAGISIPAALDALVGAFIGLDDFHVMSQYTAGPGAQASHSLAPDDLAFIPSNRDNFDCYPLATNGVDVSFPASIPEVTAVGGGEFNEGSGAYWNALNTVNSASAVAYIPEMAWNGSQKHTIPNAA